MACALAAFVRCHAGLATAKAVLSGVKASRELWMVALALAGPAGLYLFDLLAPTC